VNFSSNLKPTKGDVVRLQLIYGKGVENYMNDSPVDVGIERNPGNTISPIVGKPVPLVGLVAFLDHAWSERFSSTMGYSLADHHNLEGQAPDSYKRGHYALFNLLYTPVPNAMMGGEIQWGRRQNFSDGFHSDGVKIQFAFKYNFSHTIGG
jgi:hypothetical protein